MADIIADGKTRWGYAPAIANMAAPTVAELNAGILLTNIITPDGVIGFEMSTADVPNGSLASTFNPNRPGRDSLGDTRFRFKKQDVSDTVHNTLGLKNVTGFLVRRRSIAQSTGWASTQKVEVYPIETGRRNILPDIENTVEKYEVPFKVTDDPNLDAVIA